MEFTDFVNKWIPEHSPIDMRSLCGVYLFIDKNGKLKDLTWIDPTSIGNGRYLHRWVSHDRDRDPLPDVKNIHECKVGKIDIHVKPKIEVDEE